VISFVFIPDKREEKTRQEKRRGSQRTQRKTESTEKTEKDREHREEDIQVRVSVEWLPKSITSA
jgi:hypothetical protein